MFFCLKAHFVAAQDIHFSQFHRSPANLNPALNGVFAADLRFTGNYRSQWQSVPVPYETFSGAFDAKYAAPFLGRKASLGYGLLFNHDAQGDGNLSLNEIGGNIAYIRQLGDPVFLSLGVQLRAGQRSVQPEKLTFEEQHNGEIFDPSRAVTEAFTNTGATLASVSSGVNLHAQSERSRTKLDFGLGMFHLNRPSGQFLEQSEFQLPVKWQGYVMVSLEVHPNWDIRGNALVASQSSYREMVAGVAARYHLNLEKGKELAVQAGVSVRLGDAVIPAIELQVRNWEAGISYDINTSPFEIATRQRGGPELFVQYVIWKVHAPKEFKACPVF